MKKIINTSKHLTLLWIIIFSILHITTASANEADEQLYLEVEDNVLYIDGVITSDAPEKFKQIFHQYPQIDSIVMGVVDGSIDDDANLQAAIWLAKKQLIFILTSESEIASGGTDLFLAGKERVIYQGAKVGVHSWSSEDEGEKASDFPKGHPAHAQYIDYYMAIGWSKEQAEKFYYFTINAASPEDIYWMTAQELIEYSIITMPIQQEN